MGYQPQHNNRDFNNNYREAVNQGRHFHQRDHNYNYREHPAQGVPHGHDYPFPPARDIDYDARNFRSPRQQQYRHNENAFRSSNGFNGGQGQYYQNGVKKSRYITDDQYHEYMALVKERQEREVAQRVTAQVQAAVQPLEQQILHLQNLVASGSRSAVPVATRPASSLRPAAFAPARAPVGRVNIARRASARLTQPAMRPSPNPPPPHPPSPPSPPSTTSSGLADDDPNTLPGCLVAWGFPDEVIAEFTRRPHLVEDQSYTKPLLERLRLEELKAIHSRLFNANYAGSKASLVSFLANHLATLLDE
jgi:hypothetical protein